MLRSLLPFSGKVLNLDWRPLARDATFYSLSIAILIIFAWDGFIQLYEAILLVTLYFIYVGTMFVNEKLMMALGQLADKITQRTAKVDANRESERRQSNVFSRATTGGGNFVKSSRSGSKVTLAKDGSKISTASSLRLIDEGINLTPCIPKSKWYSLQIALSIPRKEKEGVMGFMKLLFDWFLFILSFPFYILYTLTIPPCDTEETRKYYLLSFTMAIGWIVAISFGMLFCVEELGRILEINHFTMGLVIIAVGTSIPDALSSILVAKEGFGDMAVSNAIGSNVFDINLGLGAPFLIFTAARAKPVSLLNQWQWCVISSLDYPIKMLPHVKFGFVLFAILAVTLIIFSIHKFKLDSKTGIFLFLTYVLFLVYAFTQEMVCLSYDC